jgi:hypothetical protein
LMAFHRSTQTNCLYSLAADDARLPLKRKCFETKTTVENVSGEGGPFWWSTKRPATYERRSQCIRLQPSHPGLSDYVKTFGFSGYC